MDLDEEAQLPDEHIVATDEGKETPEKPEEQTPSPEADNSQADKDMPFHQHPRWLAREQEWNQKLEKVIGETKADYESRIAGLEQRFTPREEKIASSPFLRKLVGEDPELARDWEAEKQAISQAAIEAYEAKQQQAVEAREAESKRWLNWVDTSVKGLKDSGKVFDENELKAIAVKYKPTDDLGNIDFNLAYEILMEKKSIEKEKDGEKSTARKKIAADTSSTTKGETPKKDYMTHSDFR